MEEKNKIQWFEKLRLNSWEVEILIVGFVLVMLFNIPDTLSLELTKTVNSLSVHELGDFLTWTIRLLTLGILSSIIHILIVSFSVYLGLRGFWVGILGLSSVYPKGINLKRLNFNTIFNKQISQYNFTDFIIKIDNICSSIFSFSFLISFSIVSLCLFFVEFMLLSSFLYNIDIDVAESWIGDVITLPFGLFGFLFFIDYFLFGILKKIKWKPFGYVFNIIDKFYKYITLIFIYDTLYYAFISNVKRRIIFLLMVGFIFLSTSFESFELEKPSYFPKSKSSKNIMKFRNYEDTFKQRDHYDENLYPRYPFIQSDVITENYLKLHIPYHTSMNIPIENLCPEITGIFLASDTSGMNTIDKQEEILNCINNAYTIVIDSAEIESDFVFYDYAHPLLDIKTFFMLIPLDQYTNGRHTLRIDKILKDKFKSLSFVDGKFEQELGSNSDSILHIPFYISR
jgi:hypothetical protein